MGLKHPTLNFNKKDLITPQQSIVTSPLSDGTSDLKEKHDSIDHKVPILAINAPPSGAKDIEKAYQDSKTQQLQQFAQVSPPDPDDFSSTSSELSEPYDLTERHQKIPKVPQRAQERCIYEAQSYQYAVYQGNFPQVVRDALKLRKDGQGKEIWQEVEPITNNMMAIDFVWKPVNFQRSNGWEMMAKRCLGTPERPFSYSHYENIQILSTKSGLVRTLRDYYLKTPMFKKAKYTYDYSMSVSFILPGADYLQCEDMLKVRKLFVKFDKKNITDEKLSARQINKNLWIFKPENENRGRGIEIISSYKELIHQMCGKLLGENFIVQKYIERPLLYKGRKFDIRVLALIDDLKDLYLYKPCYLRTSSNKYSLSNQSKFIHLTNNCYQMKSENYQQFEEGNQIPYSSFLEYVDQQNIPDIDKGHIMQRMKDLMIDCHQAALSNLDPKKRNGQKFELIGFDFLIDEDFRVWLIEVNTCPYQGPVLTSQHPYFMLDLLDDTFKLTIDKIFHGQTLTPEQIQKETEFELLCSSTFSQRSTLGLDEEPNKQFPDMLRGLYPAESIYQRLIKSQQKHLKKHIRLRNEEIKHQQKMMKLRNKRFLQSGSDMPTILIQPIKQAFKVQFQNKKPNQVIKKEIEVAVTNTTDVSVVNELEKSRVSSRTNLRSKSEIASRGRISSRKNIKSNQKLEFSNLKKEQLINIPKPVVKTFEKIEIKPPPRIITLVEHIQTALNNLTTSYKVGNTMNTPEDYRKTYLKHFSQAQQLISQDDPQGYEALKLLMHSHFTLFIQHEDVLGELLILVYPNEKNQAAKTDILKRILELVQSQLNTGIRDLFLTSGTLYGFLINSLMRSLEVDPSENYYHLQIFLQLCATPSKYKKKARMVYIPGETQEQRKQKKRSVQNGSIIIAQMIQIKYPNLEPLIKSCYLHVIEWQDLLNHFMSIIDFTQRKFSQNKQEVSHIEMKVYKYLNIKINISERKSAMDVWEKESMQNPSQYQKIKLEQKNLHSKMREFVKNEIITSQKFIQMKNDAERLDTKINRHQSTTKNYFSDLTIDEIFRGDPFLNCDYIQQQFSIFKKIIVKKSDIEEPQGVFRVNLMNHINRSQQEEEIQNNLAYQSHLDQPIDRELYKICSNEKVKLTSRNNIVDRFVDPKAGNSKGRTKKLKSTQRGSIEQSPMGYIRKHSGLQSVGRYKKQQHYVTTVDQIENSYQLAPIDVVKLDNGLPFKNSRLRLSEQEEISLTDASKRPKPALPQRVGMTLNDGYKKAIRILHEIQKNEKEIQQLMINKQQQV